MTCTEKMESSTKFTTTLKVTQIVFCLKSQSEKALLDLMNWIKFVSFAKQKGG